MTNNLVEQFVNRDLTLLIQEKKITSFHVLEAIGVLGLLHDASASGKSLSPQIDEATTVFVKRLLVTYENEDSSSEIIAKHLQWAFKQNPALILLLKKLNAHCEDLQRSNDQRAAKAKAFLEICRPSSDSVNESLPGEKQSILDILSRRGRSD